MILTDLAAVEPKLLCEPFVRAHKVMLARATCRFLRDNIIEHASPALLFFDTEPTDPKERLRTLLLRLRWWKGLGLSLNIEEPSHSTIEFIKTFFPTMLSALVIRMKFDTESVLDMIRANCDTLQEVFIDAKLVRYNSEERVMLLANALCACKCLSRVFVTLPVYMKLHFNDIWRKFKRHMREYNGIFVRLEINGIFVRLEIE